MAGMLACVFAFTAVLVPSGPAAAQSLILGDSLSKEYYIEFASDGYPSAVKNWIELLDARRSPAFDYGSSGTFPDYRLIGHEYNWSIPTGKIREFVDIVEGKTLIDQFSRSTLRDQLRDEVDRVILFVGGNDADSVYGTPYNGGSLDAFIDSFTADLTEVLDWVISVNSDLEIVLVNVPHVGATPKVRSEYPFDPLKTGRCTAEYARLNDRLRELADDRGVGYADLFAYTVPLADPAMEWICLDGVRLLNASSEDGDLDHLWLGGDVADDFHPNTGPQAQVANLVIEAFNARYDTGIAPLSDEEILESILGLDRDVPFADWATCHGIAGAAPEDDADRDGAALLVEFALGLDPNLADAAGNPQVEFVPAGGNGQPASIVLRYRPRVPGSTRVRIVPEVSDGFVNWSPVDEAAITMSGDGVVTVTLPIDPDHPARLLRLRVDAL